MWPVSGRWWHGGVDRSKRAVIMERRDSASGEGMVVEWTSQNETKTSIPSYMLRGTGLLHYITWDMGHIRTSTSCSDQLKPPPPDPC